MSSHFRRNAIGVAVLSLLSCAAWAQADASAPAPSLPEVTVTGNPLGATDLIAPTTTLSGDRLLLRSQSTLGETLNGLPGVSSSYFGPWTARLGFDHYAAQRRVPSIGARETDAFTLWNAALTYRMKVQRANLTWYARIDNLTNKLAYSATSILTTTAFPDAPLPGRTLKVGLRATF